MSRRYRCSNVECSNYHMEIQMVARELEGGYCEFPTVVCMCGHEPKITSVNGVQTGV